MGAYRPTGLRMLAPVSLVVFAMIFLIVVVNSLDNGSGSRDNGGPATESRTVQRKTEPQRLQTQTSRRVYFVKEGDTLVKIAEKTGVSIEQLLSLNPTIDPQGLVTGQRVKLRE